MTINSRLFHRVDGMIAHENGKEKLEETHTLDPGLAINRHLGLLRGVLQNDEEYNINLRIILARLVDFSLNTIVIHRCYIRLEKLFNRRLQIWD